jgi:hypothetical protein
VIGTAGPAWSRRHTMPCGGARTWDAAPMQLKTKYKARDHVATLAFDGYYVTVDIRICRIALCKVRFQLSEWPDDRMLGNPNWERKVFVERQLTGHYPAIFSDVEMEKFPEVWMNREFYGELICGAVRELLAKIKEPARA